MRTRWEVGGRGEERPTEETRPPTWVAFRTKEEGKGGGVSPSLCQERGGFRAGHALPPRPTPPPRGPAGSPGCCSDQGMWLLVFNFHLSRISLPKISGLKGRVGTSGSALRMRVWRSLTAARGRALGRDGPAVPLGLWGVGGQPGAKGRCPSKLGTPPSPDQGSVTCRAKDPETQV